MSRPRAIAISPSTPSDAPLSPQPLRPKTAALSSPRARARGRLSRRASVAVRAAGADPSPPRRGAARAIVSRAPRGARGGVATLASLALADPRTRTRWTTWRSSRRSGSSARATPRRSSRSPCCHPRPLRHLPGAHQAEGGGAQGGTRRGRLDRVHGRARPDADTLTLVQLNAFAAAAERDLLDDGMVTEFVRQVAVDEKWKVHHRRRGPRLAGPRRRGRRSSP